MDEYDEVRYIFYICILKSLGKNQGSKKIYQNCTEGKVICLLPQGGGWQYFVDKLFYC
jgi:hypothetical protein